MPTNTTKNKKNRRKGKSGCSATSNGKDGDSDVNLNAQVLESLTRLSDMLARLDESREDDGGDNCNRDGDAPAPDTPAPDTPEEGAYGEASGADATVDDGFGGADEDSLAEFSALMSLHEGADESSGAPSSLRTLLHPRPPLLSHWRSLPVEVESAFSILDDGAGYIHATSTKYALVGKVDAREGGNLALELQKGAQLIGTGTRLLFSPTCGSSRSLKRYAKQHSRAVLASVVSLVRSFEDGSARGRAGDGNSVGAQKTGAVWSACDGLVKTLPRGNRAAMRRELMTWVRDCIESIDEFEEVLGLGPRDEDDDAGERQEEDTMIHEDQYQYTESEIGVARASVNVMKCSKNFLGLVLKACECAGGHVESLTKDDPEAKSKCACAEETKSSGERPNNKASEENGNMHYKGVANKKGNEVLRWIGELHEMARMVGEGVTNLGILLYPPLDLLRQHDESDGQQLNKIEAATPASSSCSEGTNLRLSTTTLELQLERQLHALLECAAIVNGAPTLGSREGAEKSISEEVQRLAGAVEVRRKEVQRAIAGWDPRREGFSDLPCDLH